MKTKTILLTVITLCLLIGGAGCEKTTYEIYENHEIAACGVKDPLNNLQWLKDFCEKNYNKINLILVLKNINTNESSVLINANADNEFVFENVYNCKGEVIYRTYFGGSPDDRYWIFHNENPKIATIWEKKTIEK